MMDRTWARPEGKAAAPAWAAGIIVLALLIQFVAAAQKSYWEDEAWTAALAQSNPVEIIAASSEDVHPPLQYIVYWAWGRVFGFEELGLRSISILLIGATLWLSYLLAVNLFDARTGLITILLLAVSPFFLTFGHNVRYYSLSSALTLAEIYLAYRYYQSGKPVYLILYVLGGMAFLYTNYMAAGVIALCFLWGLFLRRAQAGTPRNILPWVMAQVILFLAFLPWGAFFLSRYSGHGNLAGDHANLVVEFAKRLFYLGYSFVVGGTISPLNPIAWIGLGVVAGVMASMIVGFRRVKTNQWFLLGFIAFFSITSIVISFVASYPVSAPQAIPNHIFYVYPFFVMLVASRVSNMRAGASLVVLALLSVVGAYGIFNYFTGRQLLIPMLNVPWREVMSEMKREARPDAVMICTGDYSCAYYLKRYGYNVFYPADWSRLAGEGHSEVWWLQLNFGGYDYSNTVEKLAFAQIKAQYQDVSVENYGLHDPSIRWLKSRLTPSDDYQYRLNVYRFSEPSRP